MDELTQRYLTYGELGAALGISKQAVHRLRRRGMPVDSIEGAVRWREANLDPTRMKGARVVLAHSDVPEQMRTPMEGPDPADLLPDVDLDNAAYRAARAARERVRLEAERLALGRMRAELIDRDQAQAIAAAAYGRVRSALQGVARRLGQQLACEMDPFAIEQALERELDAALSSLDFKSLADSDAPLDIQPEPGGPRDD